MSDRISAFAARYPIASGVLMAAGLVASLIAITLILGACGIKDEIDEKRGRGDAPVESVDDIPKEVVQFPDRFSNVAHGCDGHGHRIFVTTKSDQSRFMAVINDESC